MWETANKYLNVLPEPPCCPLCLSLSSWSAVRPDRRHRVNGIHRVCPRRVDRPADAVGGERGLVNGGREGGPDKGGEVIVDLGWRKALKSPNHVIYFLLAADQVWSPYSSLPRLKSQERQGSRPRPRKGPCGDGARRRPSTRDDKKGVFFTGASS